MLGKMGTFQSFSVEIPQGKVTNNRHCFHRKLSFFTRHRKSGVLSRFQPEAQIRTLAYPKMDDFANVPKYMKGKLLSDRVACCVREKIDPNLAQSIFSN
jgi:hypothetical protein